MFLPNFTIGRSDREFNTVATKHGGVRLALKNLIHEVQEDKILVEHVAVEFPYGRTTFLLSCIYNPPKGSPYRILLQSILALLEFLHCKALEENKLVLITGDLNMNHTDWVAMSSEDDYEYPIVQKLAHHSFAQILESTEQKLLDVFLVNKPEFFLSFTQDEILKTQYSLDNKNCSEHVAIRSVLDAYAVHKNARTVFKYAYKKTDWISFSNAISKEHFSPFCFSNVDKLANQWYLWINDHINKNIPRVTSHRSSLTP